MTDSVMDNASSNIVQNQNQQGQDAAQQAAQAAQERLFRQAEVNDIVGRAKREAVESFKRQQDQAIQQQQPSYQTQPNSAALSKDDVKRLAAEEITDQRDKWAKETQERADLEAAQRIVNSYKEKIAQGKEKYTDFEAVTNNVDMRYYPNVVQLLADHVDNSHDVLYYMANNRTKLYQLEATCGHSPHDAIHEIKRLSQSIKDNDHAANIKHPNAPLSQQKPSNTGTGSDGAVSIRDLRRKYRV